MLKNKEKLERAKQIASYIVLNETTVRKAAEKFGISKSTVHKDVTHRLRKQDRELYNEVRKVLDYNISQRAIRGGMATKAKFENKK